jgi:predicted transglutaminase-like cysteine proteinase
VSLVLCLHGAPRIDRIEQAAAQHYGASAVAAVRAWGAMLDAAAALPEARKVQRVNTFFNRRIAFGEDQDIWGQPDFWATPLDTLARGAGDCEDFAIAKYVSLRMLGLSDVKLRLIYVRARIGGPHSGVSQAHMVLGYYPEPGGEPLVLDNLIDDAQPAASRADLLPIFSFNSDGLWAGAAVAPVASATARLSRWRGVLARMRAQGFDFK